MAIDVDAVLTLAAREEASDAHFTVGMPPSLRRDGDWVPLKADALTPDDCQAVALHLLGERRFAEFDEAKEFDLSYTISGVARYRVNAFFQRGSVGVAARVLPYAIPRFEDLGLPVETMKELTSAPNGIVLVCGSTGSGKSTTLAAMVSHINRNFKKHVVTIEDPVEFVHAHDRSIVDQREVGVDTTNFAEAMRHVLRQSPDVVLVGEIRDPETVQTAMMIAETGHLVLSTIHSGDVIQGLSRLVDIFPEGQRSEIRVSLSLVLRGMVVQQLLPCLETRQRVLAYELMLSNAAIRNLIREGKFEQVYNQLHTGQGIGMRTMNTSLFDLWRAGKISREIALLRSPAPSELTALMERSRSAAI